MELTPSQPSSSSEFVVVPNLDGAGPSGPVVVIVSSDFNSKEEIYDDSYYPVTHSYGY